MPSWFKAAKNAVETGADTVADAATDVADAAGDTAGGAAEAVVGTVSGPDKDGTPKRPQNEAQSDNRPPGDGGGDTSTPDGTGDNTATERSTEQRDRPPGPIEWAKGKTRESKEQVKKRASKGGALAEDAERAGKGGGPVLTRAFGWTEKDLERKRENFATERVKRWLREETGGGALGFQEPGPNDTKGAVEKGTEAAATTMLDVLNPYNYAEAAETVADAADNPATYAANPVTSTQAGGEVAATKAKAAAKYAENNPAKAAGMLAGVGLTAGASAAGAGSKSVTATAKDAAKNADAGTLKEAAKAELDPRVTPFGDYRGAVSKRVGGDGGDGGDTSTGGSDTTTDARDPWADVDPSKPLREQHPDRSGGDASTGGDSGGGGGVVDTIVNSFAQGKRRGIRPRIAAIDALGPIRFAPRGGQMQKARQREKPADQGPDPLDGKVIEDDGLGTPDPRGDELGQKAIDERQTLRDEGQDARASDGYTPGQRATWDKADRQGDAPKKLDDRDYDDSTAGQRADWKRDTDGQRDPSADRPKIDADTATRGAAPVTGVGDGGSTGPTPTPETDKPGSSKADSGPLQRDSAGRPYAPFTRPGKASPAGEAVALHAQAQERSVDFGEEQELSVDPAGPARISEGTKTAEEVFKDARQRENELGATGAEAPGIARPQERSAARSTVDADAKLGADTDTAGLTDTQTRTATAQDTPTDMDVSTPSLSDPGSSDRDFGRSDPTGVDRMMRDPDIPTAPTADRSGGDTSTGADDGASDVFTNPVISPGEAMDFDPFGGGK